MLHEFRQIKASAGSGKTYTLTERFLSLLAEASSASWKKTPSGCTVSEAGEDYGWQEILAITFTNKAAAEMRERLLNRLKDFALAPSRRRGPTEERFWTPSRATAAVDALIRSYGSLNVRTIDSLLHLMVRLSALDFDLSPDFEPRFNEKDITGPLFDLMAEQARDGDEALAGLFRQACRQMLLSENVFGFIAGNRIRDRVIGMAGLMLNADGWSPAELASPEQAESHLHSLLSEIVENARTLQHHARQEDLKLSKYFAVALAACADCEGSPALLPDSTTLRKDSLDENLLKASKGKASVQSCALYESLRDDVNEVRILLKARRLMPFAALAHGLYDRLEEQERRTGIIAASQIPRLAIRASDEEESGPGELFCRMGAPVTHILIDEFQDTSRDQWLALQPLAKEALARGGSLAIVGDVKQAIYGWRGGDAALFDALVKPGSALLSQVESPAFQTLPFNWRSRERIVAWNNALFSPIGDPDRARGLLADMADGSTELLNRQAALLSDAFQGASQSAEKCREGGYVELRHLTKGQERAELLSQLPQLVEELGRRHPWGDICILVRSNEQASLAASWLMARHIPVVTQGSLLLSEQPAVAELVSLLRFINTPEDDLAFWDVLTGTQLLPPLLCEDSAGLSPEKLADWAARRRPNVSLARQFSRDFPDVWEKTFAPLYSGASLLTPYDAAMEVLERWRVMERCRGAEGFLRRFLEVLFNAEEQGISDLSGFLDFWDENGAQEKAPLPESMDAVRIMTMHKAKGLEFDVVILPWMDFPLGRSSDDHAICWNSRGTKVLAPLCREMGDPWRSHRMDTARESLHLAYVAMTRAITELYCFMAAPECSQVSAMLDALVGRLRPSLQEYGDREFWGSLPEIRNTDLPTPESAPTPKVSSPETDGPVADHGTTERSEASDTAPDECPGAEWQPMDWLPRLRMFRSPLEDWTLTARRRGTLIHHCMESLQVSGTGRESARKDAELAAARGLSTFPLPVLDKENVLADITEDLAWFASLPEAAHWLAFGTPEHALLDSDGRQYRVDLLVDDGQTLTAVEYKTGTPGDLPAPAHTEQLSRYLHLLAQASDLPVRGALVYLDRRAVFPLALTDTGALHD